MTNKKGFDTSTRVTAHILFSSVIIAVGIVYQVGFGITIFTLFLFNLGMVHSFTEQNEKINEEFENKEKDVNNTK